MKPKTLLPVFFLLFACVAHGQTPYGFKGLLIGMTRAQVDSLIRATPWRVNTDPDSRSQQGDEPVTDPGQPAVVLVIDPEESFARIGCMEENGSPGMCVTPTMVVFLIKKNVVSLIEVVMFLNDHPSDSPSPSR